MGAIETIMSAQCDVRRKPSLCEAACIGACCMAEAVLELKASEVDYMAERGTAFRVMDKKEYPKGYKPPKGKLAVLLESDCANLDPETRMCTDYVNRPEACQELRPDSRELSTCHAMRIAARARVLSGTVDLPMPVVPKFNVMVNDLAEASSYRDVQAAYLQQEL